MTMRLSQSSLTGTDRTLVAVGTVRLASMFCDRAGRGALEDGVASAPPLAAFSSRLLGVLRVLGLVVLSLLVALLADSWWPALVVPSASRLFCSVLLAVLASRSCCSALSCWSSLLSSFLFSTVPASPPSRSALLVVLALSSDFWLRGGTALGCAGRLGHGACRSPRSRCWNLRSWRSRKSSSSPCAGPCRRSPTRPCPRCPGPPGTSRTSRQRAIRWLRIPTSSCPQLTRARPVSPLPTRAWVSTPQG